MKSSSSHTELDLRFSDSLHIRHRCPLIRNIFDEGWGHMIAFIAADHTFLQLFFFFFFFFVFFFLFFSFQSLEDLQSEIESFTPPRVVQVPQSRILVLGPVGAGKSSFFNTVASVFRGRVTSQASCGSAEHSVKSQVSLQLYKTTQTLQERKL